MTFCTERRKILPPQSRTIALAVCVAGHRKDYWLHCACVMPDHLHLVFTPYETTTMFREIARIKSVASHQINQGAGTHGRIWQREYFDRILRSDEDIRKKCEYVCANPVRAGLVANVDDYGWIWREWIEGRQ